MRVGLLVVLFFVGCGLEVPPHQDSAVAVLQDEFGDEVTNPSDDESSDSVTEEVYTGEYAIFAKVNPPQIEPGFSSTAAIEVTVTPVPAIQSFAYFKFEHADELSGVVVNKAEIVDGLANGVFAAGTTTGHFEIDITVPELGSSLLSTSATVIVTEPSPATND